MQEPPPGRTRGCGWVGMPTTALFVQASVPGHRQAPGARRPGRSLSAFA